MAFNQSKRLKISHFKDPLFSEYVVSYRNKYFKDFSADYLEDCKPSYVKISSFILHRCNVYSVPPDIALMVNLANLDLSCNSLSIIPPELGNLYSLTKLNLSNNKLISLPSTLSNLTRLFSVKLNDNLLSRLPDFSKCQLYDLDASKNLLTHIPITNKHIYCLRISSNKIEYFNDTGILSPVELFIENNPVHDKLFKNINYLPTPSYVFSILKKIHRMEYSILWLGGVMGCDMPILEALYINWKIKRTSMTKFVNW